MGKKIIAGASLVLQCLLLYSQKSDTTTFIFNEIFESQQIFLNNNIPKGERANYAPELKIASYIRSHIAEGIAEIDPNFFSNNLTSLYIVEGYQPAYGSIFGIIWKDSVFYTYGLINKEPIIKSVRKRTFHQIEKQDQEIVRNFLDWNNKIFSHIRADMYTSNDGVYYFGSTYSIFSIPKVKSFAFYY